MVRYISVFAIEVWSRDGVYYSTENGEQLNNAQIRVLGQSALPGEISGDGNRFVELSLLPSEPVTLWDASGEQHIEVEFPEEKSIRITFEQLRD